MARKATAKGKSGAKPKGSRKSVAKARPSSGSRTRSGGSRAGRPPDMGEAFIKLLQSPLVADLVAVAATSALAALAEHGFTHRGDEGTRSKRAGKAVKEAGKAAAAAVGRRLSSEIEEVRKASKSGAKA